MSHTPDDSGTVTIRQKDARALVDCTTHSPASSLAAGRVREALEAANKPAGQPMTIAYIAMGAARAFDEATNAVGGPDVDVGEADMIADLIRFAPMLDRLLAEGAALQGSFLYDIAEPFGRALADEILIHGIDHITDEEAYEVATSLMTENS